MTTPTQEAEQPRSVVKGYILGDGRYVGADYMEQYALKSGEAEGESRQLPPDRFTGQYDKDGLVVPLYNLEALARLMEVNTYHMRAVKTKARDTVGLGWSLKGKHGVDEPNGRQKESVLALLDNPHPDLEFDELLYRAMVDYEAIGWGLLECIRKAPKEPLTGLAHMPGHTVRIHKDRIRLAQIRGQKKVWFKRLGANADVHFEKGTMHELGTLPASQRATEVLAFINYSSRSDYYGLPDVMPALGAVLGDAGRRDYNIKFFENHAIPAYAVVVTGADLDEPTEQVIHEFFHKQVKGNPHSTLVLTVPTPQGREVKIEFHKLNVEIRDASFRLYRQDNRDEILAAHAVPPYRAGIAETGSLGGNTARESTEIYKASVIQPRQEMLEVRLTKRILWAIFDAKDWVFKFNEIDTRDEAHDREQHESYFDMGVLSPNDIRERVYGDRVPDEPALDRYYIGGRPVTGVAGGEVLDAIKGFHQELLTVVKAHGTAGGTRARTG